MTVSSIRGRSYAYFIHLWLEQSIIREKKVSSDDAKLLSWEGNYSFRRTFFSSRQLSLSSISGLKDCLASLRSADNCPSSLRSRKVKVVSRKKKFVFICIPSLDKSLSPWRNYYSVRTVHKINF